VRDVYVPLHRGCMMNIQREHSRAEPARYRVMWVAKEQVGGSADRRWREMSGGSHWRGTWAMLDASEEPPRHTL
jgi:hypothetical protein